MARLELDIVAEVHRNEHGIATDLIFEDGSRFYDVDHGLDFDLIIEEGTGGGWPVIYLRGSEKISANGLKIINGKTLIGC
ncbi:hypothetical protein ACQ31_gp040 [Salmonella phage STML-198]|uniref:Uncharacterized protein n=1 Tax=Salmonella phage STML-198 TaxID=1204531 RepID=K4I2J6_9CAUD|nr:hypothetical protein ACQ31_gp040 [Salmonella phage STML-198]AFU63923.1 hypothetical protein [Salmonella phage STML-198]